MQILLLLLPALALADQYGYQHPKLYCRETNTSVYAEVCVPQFKTERKPETLPIKIVVPDQFCYESVITTCEETTTVNKHTLCTSNYESIDEKLTGHVTKVTYQDKSETMKVTSCKASGYGSGYDAGEHQYCGEEYQTQAYKVPLVTEPLEVDVTLTAPQPKEECKEVDVEITQVVCTDDVSQKCIELVKFEDSTKTIDTETAVISEEPNCNQVTLTLPTKACSKPYH